MAGGREEDVSSHATGSPSGGGGGSSSSSDGKKTAGRSFGFRMRDTSSRIDTNNNTASLTSRALFRAHRAANKDSSSDGHSRSNSGVKSNTPLSNTTGAVASATTGGAEVAAAAASSRHGSSSFAENFAFLKDKKHYKAPAAAAVVPPCTPSASAANPTSTSTASALTSASATATATTSTTTTSLHRSGGPGASTISNGVIVSTRQRGNPLLKHIRNVAWEWRDGIGPDFILGASACALFLSVRYHKLHPDYVHGRIREIGRGQHLRVLLVLVDTKDSQTVLRDLSRLAITMDLTLIVAFSNQEAGRYIETFKVYEHKPADMLQERTSQTYLGQFTAALTTVRAVNKTDAVTLASTFGSLAGVAAASREELLLCPGFGEGKASRLHDLFREPFVRKGSKRARAAEDRARRAKVARATGQVQIPHQDEVSEEEQQQQRATEEEEEVVVVEEEKQHVTGLREVDAGSGDDHQLTRPLAIDSELEVAAEGLLVPSAKEN